MVNRDITSLFEFYGSTTVQGHGQAVIPAGVRRELDIKPGTRLLVFVPFHRQALILLKVEAIQQIQQLMNPMSTQLVDSAKQFSHGKKKATTVSNKKIPN